MVIFQVAFLGFSDHVTNILEHSVALAMDCHWLSVHCSSRRFPDCKATDSYPASACNYHPAGARVTWDEEIAQVYDLSKLLPRNESLGH